MPGTRQRPELAAAFEYASGFQLIAGDLGQIPVELQHFAGLHGVVALGDHRQRRLGIRTEQYLLLGERMDGAQMADGIRFEVHGAFKDLPVHTGFALPDFQGLLLRELITQAVPRGGSDVGHLLDEVSHKDLLARVTGYRPTLECRVGGNGSE